MFIISTKRVFETGAINFKTLALKPSWPVALFVGNLLINSRMSFSVIRGMLKGSTSAASLEVIK